MRRRLHAGALAAALLLAACGGADGEATMPGSGSTPAPVPDALAQPAAPADPSALAAQLYLLYLGRPADPAGLALHAHAIGLAGLPADAAALLARYRGDAQARQAIDALASGPEADAAAPEDAAALYRTLFNRLPDPVEAAHWDGLLAGATLTRAELPLALLAEAHPDDLALFARKLALARALTTALDTPDLQAAYQGDAAMAAVRAVLDGIDADADPARDGALVEVALARLRQAATFVQVEAVVRARCLACHSVTPTMPGFASAPRGIRFDTPDQIRADALRIYVNVVQTEFMPYGNQTRMTAAERELVRTWFEAGP